ncbi:hypothetical protein V5O48_013686 [Marasmius crinis-equi]|uniref:Uncharacterized protein n=1 Tax=Marasmius crinis-equi TaxID=585013 RepID=A0ABR3EZJ4_9AGAR
MFHLLTQSGAQTKIKNYKEQTGVNDSTSAAAMQSIVELGKVLYSKTHLESNGLEKTDVELQLQEEVTRAINEHGINPLIGMPGKFCLSSVKLVRMMMNFSLAVGMHQDTPTEILHTILLGVVKYFWGQTVYILDKAKLLSTLEVRLASVDTSAMNIPKLSAEYICTYRGSLIGKHFKSLAQLMPFLIHNIVPKKVVDAWTIIGELVVLIWHTEFKNLETYLSDMNRSITSSVCLVFTATGKLQVVIHVKHLRLMISQSILSREATGAIGSQSDGFKQGHMCDRMQRVTHSIRNFFSSQIKQKMDEESQVNEILTPLVWSQTGASVASNASDFVAVAEEQQFLAAIAMVAENGDKVKSNMFAAIRCRNQCEKFFVARLKEVIALKSMPSSAKIVRVEMFDFLPEPHDLLRVPMLRPRLVEDGHHKNILVAPDDVMCGLNVQHDCATAQCSRYKNIPIAQERLEIARTRTVIDHNDDEQFLLNTHTLHNHLFMPKLLPDSLVSVLTRPPLPAEEQKALRLRAAQHVRTQKETQNSLGNGESTAEHGTLVLCPFERGRGRGCGGQGRGRGRGSGAGQEAGQDSNHGGTAPPPAVEPTQTSLTSPVPANMIDAPTVSSENVLPQVIPAGALTIVPTQPAKKKRGPRKNAKSGITSGGVQKRGRGRGRGGKGGVQS